MHVDRKHDVGEAPAATQSATHCWMVTHVVSAMHASNDGQQLAATQPAQVGEPPIVITPASTPGHAPPSGPSPESLGPASAPVPLLPPDPAVPPVPAVPPLPSEPPVPKAPPLPDDPPAPAAPPLPSDPSDPEPAAPPLPALPPDPLAPPTPDDPPAPDDPRLPRPPPEPALPPPPVRPSRRPSSEASASWEPSAKSCDTSPNGSAHEAADPTLSMAAEAIQKLRDRVKGPSGAPSHRS